MRSLGIVTDSGLCESKMVGRVKIHDFSLKLVSAECLSTALSPPWTPELVVSILPPPYQAVDLRVWLVPT